MHREQRTARVSESADTDEPQKKQSIVTLLSDFFRRTFVLATGNLHKSYTLSIPLWRSIVNTLFNLGIYYNILIKYYLLISSNDSSHECIEDYSVHSPDYYLLFSVVSRGRYPLFQNFALNPKGHV